MIKFIKAPKLFPSIRLLMSILIFFGYCFQYMLKINMSIAIVCMVNNTALGIVNYQNSSGFSDISVQSPEECTASLSHHKPIVTI